MTYTDIDTEERADTLNKHKPQVVQYVKTLHMYPPPHMRHMYPPPQTAGGAIRQDPSAAEQGQEKRGA
jgi:hypothetical protein